VTRLFSGPEHLDYPDVIEVAMRIEDDGTADCLTALRGATAPGKYRNITLTGDFEDGLDVLDRAWKDYPKGFDLIMRRIGGVEPAGQRIETYLTLDGSREDLFELWIAWVK
jgi:hypothetical protein